MSELKKPPVGTIGWIDLTVPNAVEVRDFYTKVVGYEIAEVSMGDYDDYCLMVPETDHPAAGVCHASGPNKDLPPTWLIYMTVANVEESLALVTKNGGEILRPAREVGGGLMAVIKDPGGAISALYQAPEPGTEPTE